MHRVSTDLLLFFVAEGEVVDGLQMLFMFMHFCVATDTCVPSSLYSIGLRKGRPQVTEENKVKN
jgi:hypothetical protein